MLKLGKYRHYKGKEYEVIGIAKHSETLEDLVVYRAFYGNMILWVRPLKMFMEEVEVDGKKIPRFKFLGKKMEYRHYPNTIKFITERLRKKFPKVKPREDLKNVPANLFWMMEKIQSFDDSAKAGRWIGWIMARAEILGIMTNKQSRKLVKMDCRQGFTERVSRQ